MKKYILICLLLLFTCTASGVFAQKTYPEPEEMRPGMSEFWLPQPTVVAPGDIRTNTAPSDAIVLFEG